MLSGIKLYIAMALLALTVAGGLYVTYLRHRVASQAARIETLAAEVEGQKRALKAVEELGAKRQATQADLEVTRKEVERAPEAAVPAPIERALDGLRGHQRKAGRT